jgi:hypothetical protein
MPKQQDSKAMNQWMQERSPVENEDRQQDIDNMTAKGQLPPGLVARTYREFETEGYANKLRFNISKNEYQLERVSKANGSVTQFNGTLEHIADMQGFELAVLQFEANTLADQNEPLVGEEKECVEWLSTIHGADFNSIMDIKVAGIVPWELMQAELDRQSLPVCKEHLERAYVTIADRNHSNFEPFFAMRDSIARAAVARQAKAEKRKTLKGEIPAAATPFVNLPAENLARKAEDNVNRAKPLDQLRREAIPALSGEKIQTTPSTGSGRSF